MGRKRSAKIKKANPSWHGIDRLLPQDYFENATAKNFFKEKYSGKTPLEIEVGLGSGSFLGEAAKKNPQTQFLGIEYASRFLKYFRDRLEEEPLNNVSLLCTDAKLFFRHALPKESVNAVHVYFPDPWPRRSQQKKRFLSEGGVQEVERVLKEEGLLFFSTDYEEYAQSVQKILNGSKNLILMQQHQIKGISTAMDPPQGYSAYSLTTHFGERFSKQGKTIHFFVIQKTGRPDRT